MITLTNSEFAELTAFVKVNFGLDLANKKTFVEIRLQKLMAESKAAGFAEYFSDVCMDFTGKKVAEMVSCLTVNYSMFCREAFHFDYLKSTVLPYWIKQEQKAKDLRIWSAGCATGEEPYTIAMLMADFLNTQKPLWDTTILATDISTTALAKARAGVYDAAAVQTLNPAWVARFFVPDKEQVRVTQELKNEVVFLRHNLVTDAFNFKQKFHIIFCRNVMIYFDESTKNLLLNRLYNVLEEGGYLFIGLSETIDKQATPFEYVMPAVYRKGGKNQ